MSSLAHGARRSLRLALLVFVVASSGVAAGCGLGGSSPSGGSALLGSGGLASGSGGQASGSAGLASPFAAIPTAAASITGTPVGTRGKVPPVASLSVDGGDPLPGQLGTYIWADGGSDSDWLPGTPLTVGSGERLIVTMAPEVPLRAWRARYTAARATDPTGAKALLEGVGRPTFPAPPPGTWTVEVALTFDEDAGSASYFWQITVSP